MAIPLTKGHPGNRRHHHRNPRFSAGPLCPRRRAALLDLRPAYRYWYRTLQLLQWQKRRRGLSAQRWVLKTPMHLAFVDHILELLPDATFVQTHRDPLTTIPSYASMVHELWLGVSVLGVGATVEIHADLVEAK